MLQKGLLYFIPSHGEFLKMQPGTGDNLSPEDIAAGFTDYVIWNRFRAECLDIDGELPMECIDSGIVLQDSRFREDDDFILKRVLEFAYGSPTPIPVFLQKN